MASFKSQLSEWYQNKFQESFNTNKCLFLGGLLGDMLPVFWL